MRAEAGRAGWMSSAEDRSGPRVAVVGCGRWGRNHVRNYAELGALAGVVDADPALAAEQAGRFGVPALSFEQALQDPGIAGLVFALPPAQNLPLGLQALAAGKHLFVEKPLALSVADGEQLCAAAERHGRVLMVGHILQYHPAFVELARLVGAGRLGRILSIVSTRLDLGAIRRQEDALWALAPHDVSMVLALIGEEPDDVQALGTYQTHPAIADTTTVTLAFPGGASAEIRSSWLHPYKEQRLVVVGSDAMAVFDDREPWERKLVLHPYAITETGGTALVERPEPQSLAVEQGEPLRLECRQFLDSIGSAGSPKTDGREGLRVLRVLEVASAALLSRYQVTR
jgi:UDP-2-acetamido-3-amino-2,3-dideoxy-glucuronate N-acetyltransferase